MSLQSTTNNLENCKECLSNIATLLCKECNSILCQKCWYNIHNNNLKSHNIHKSHSSPIQLLIPIKDILSFIHFINNSLQFYIISFEIIIHIRKFIHFLINDISLFNQLFIIIFHFIKFFA